MIILMLQSLYVARENQDACTQHPLHKYVFISKSTHKVTRKDTFQEFDIIAFVAGKQTSDNLMNIFTF